MRNAALELWIEWQGDNEINEKRFNDFFTETITSQVLGYDPYERPELIFAFLKMKEAFVRWLKEGHPHQDDIITHVEQDWQSNNFMKLWDPTFLQRMEAETRSILRLINQKGDSPM